MKNLLVALVCFGFSFSAFSFPAPPQGSQHPGASKRGAYKKIEIKVIRKGSFLYLPEKQGQLPLVVFSHGQALNESHYESLFKHLASQGIAVFYPKYDKGFFDTRWNRMGEDYANLVSFILNEYPQLNESQVVYSGHSKGGYVALMALGSKSGFLNPKAAVLFSPAGYDEEALKLIDPSVKLTLVYPQDDNIIKWEDIKEIFAKAPTTFKQTIQVQGYSDLMPGHFMPLTKKSLFGGRDGVGPFHYYGILPWLHGALFDSSYLYGDLATDSGDPSYPHVIMGL
ncbi:MAG: alpha/beta hydrolase [Halobacteriovoraceae bacterium]|nr:alpha/beta hydrolase [Halobacteriovoraceae bacterium]